MAVRLSPAHAPGAWLEAGWVIVVSALWALPIALFLVGSAYVDVRWALASGALGAAVTLAAWRTYPALQRLHARERGRAYRLLGVPFFGRFVVRGRHARQLERRLGAPPVRALDARRVQTLLRNSLLAERIHAAALAGSLPLMVAAWVLGQAGWLAFFAAANLVVNVYPILLQRSLRARAQRVLAGRA